MKRTLAALLLLGVMVATGLRQSAAEDQSLPTDPIAALNIPGHSAARLATPVRLPLERTLPGPITDWVLLTSNGSWGKEYLLNLQPLDAKGFRYAQRSGRACQGMKAWWMLANRRTGQGLALMLAYMGNWTFEVAPHGQDLIVRLATAPPGLEPFATIQGIPIPGALMAEFTGHWDYGAQPITRFIREKLLRDMGKAWPLAQYNSWYDTEEKITQDQVFQEARTAAAVGCELFTLDAGWFGQGLDADWSRSLGDWQVNRARFPGGLEMVAGEVRRLGMKFGLWFEIECAHPSSRLAKAHPDWFLADPRGRLLSKRGVLDFGKPEVLAHAKEVIDGAMARYRLDYIKMDFNTDPAIDNQALAPADDPLYRHYRGLAELWTWMHGKYPALIVENCASGSLRQELTAAAYTDTHWVSDDIKNESNLLMNFGATYLFPPSVCSHWTTQLIRLNKTIDLDAQFAISMTGHMGLSGPIASWGAEKLDLARTRIAQYKRLRSLIRAADVYHLTTQRPGAMQSALYVEEASGKGLLFAFHGGDPQMQHVIKLRGLDAKRNYRVSVLPGPGKVEVKVPGKAGTEARAAGQELIEKGLSVTFPNSGACVLVELEPVG